MARKLFISYSHYDADLLGELRVHLRPFERQGIIAPWYDGYLIPGDDFDREIRKALAECDFIGLLVTPRFLASDYCVDVEMDDAIARHLKGLARVVPIIAKPCGWKATSLHKLIAIPKDGKPVTTWSNADEAWHSVAEDLSRAASAATAQQPALVATPPNSEPAPPFGQPRLRLPLDRKPTDQDIDDFRHASFETVAAQFEEAIQGLSDGFSGRFRRLDANRFTATLYVQGTKKAGCTVFTGGNYFGSRGIAYHGSDNGETNTMNEDLHVEVGEGGLALKPTLGRMFRSGSDKLMSPEDAAAYLWEMFTERLRY